jgi:hypothetical protein
VLPPALPCFATKSNSHDSIGQLSGSIDSLKHP